MSRVIQDPPIVGVVSDTRAIDGHPYHLVEELYLEALTDHAGVVPVVIPALGLAAQCEPLLERLDGIVLTGSRSNIEPRHYRELDAGRDEPRDVKRDATTLPLVRGIVRRALPMLAICRGLQEVNVALGGSLHQDLDSAGLTGHRDAAARSMAERYAPRHTVELVAGGALRELARHDAVEVNSVHQQGVKQLPRGAIPLAYAPDGLVEAFTIADARAFNLALQWHPEWQVGQHPLSRAIFAAFGEACRAGRRSAK